jgi:hypothetical protein
MSFTSWLRNLRLLSSPGRAERQFRSKPSHRKPAARFRPQLEVLEDRLTPSTLTVTTALDEFDGGTALNPAGADGQLSLREAIGAASSGDQITFAPSLNGSTIQLDYTKGEFIINKNLDIVGLGAANLAVSGQNSSRVFEIAAGATDTISGLTIENGNGGFNPGDWGPGGGIFNSGTLTVSGSILSGNYAGYISAYLNGGGGIFNTGTLTLSDSTLSGNHTVYNGGGIYNTGTLTVNASTLSGNSTSSSSDGGAIQNQGGTVAVNGSTLSGNSAGSGGAITSRDGGMVTVGNSSTISGNSAQYGGGIFSYLATLTVSDCTISGNCANLSGYSSSGGGILNIYGPLTVIDCTLSGNSAGYSGGGIASGASLVTISGSTLSGNSAASVGGGIYNYNYGALNVAGTLNVANSTVCGNTAPWGADIANYGTATVTNSDVCVINQYSSTTTVTSSISQSVFGQAVTLTANVTSTGAAMPTGTVTFLLDGSTTLGAAALNSSGQAIFTTTGLPAGTHSITAVYSGDAAFIASTSTPLTQTVLSAQQELGLIIIQVTSMVTNGILDSGNGNALITKLNNAITSLNSGNTITGDNQMNAFINQTNAFLKAGKLDSTDAQTLINDIDLAIAAALVSPI